MARHGWTPRASFRAQRSALEHSRSPDVANAPRSSHFIRDPKDHERWSPDGKRFNPGEPDAAIALIDRLAIRILRERAIAGSKPETDEIPGLPSGYSYLLQFIAHDLIQSSASLSITGGEPIEVSNGRNVPLRLQTLYGDGPNDAPHVYADHEKTDGSAQIRPLLRLGRMARAETDAAKCPLLDIPRSVDPSLWPGERSDVLIADSRNDNHPIIAQLVVLFSYLHNVIANRLRDIGEPDGDNEDERRFRRYFIARSASTLVYREIIRHDLLRRVLHQDVRDAYEGGIKLLCEPTAREMQSWRPPVEFSHGAFRFGHALVRFKYDLNGVNGGVGPFTTRLVLLKTSDLNPAGMPLDRSWIIDWSRFFDRPDRTPPPNLALRIRPQMNALEVIPGEEAEIYKGCRVSGSIAFRDNFSSVVTKPWSLAPLLEEIRKSVPHAKLLASSRILAPGSWIKPLRGWLLSDPDPETRLPSADAEQIANDPPLPFFTLFEADHDQQGERLGVLGSIITADVLYGILRHDRIVAGEPMRELADRMRELGRSFSLQEGALTDLADLTSMPALLRFLEPHLPPPLD